MSQAKEGAAAVAPFPPPPKYYEEFEPFSNKTWQCIEPPKPIEGPYVMFGTLYDTSFEPQHPTTAAEAHGLALPDSKSPVETLRQLNRALPEEYLKLIQLMIDRPALCTSEDDQVKIKEIDEQREKIEKIIGSMYMSLSRFRPHQARQALITALRAQVERRKSEAKALKECREKAQVLITSAATQLKTAKDNLEKEAKDKSDSDVHPLDAVSAQAAAKEQAQAKEEEATKQMKQKGNSKGGAAAESVIIEEEERLKKRQKLKKHADLISKLDALE